MSDFLRSTYLSDLFLQREMIKRAIYETERVAYTKWIESGETNNIYGLIVDGGEANYDGITLLSKNGEYYLGNPSSLKPSKIRKPHINGFGPIGVSAHLGMGDFALGLKFSDSDGIYSVEYLNTQNHFYGPAKLFFNEAKKYFDALKSIGETKNLNLKFQFNNVVIRDFKNASFNEDRFRGHFKISSEHWEHGSKNYIEDLNKGVVLSKEDLDKLFSE